MNAYDIARTIRESFDGGDRPYRHTPETGTFAFACGGQWAVILQPFGQNIEFSCWFRPAFSIMTAAKVTEYAEKLTAVGFCGKFSVRGHETEQGKLQLSCRMLKACGDDFSAEVFAGMLDELQAALQAAGDRSSDAAEGGLTVDDAVKAVLEQYQS